MKLKACPKCGCKRLGERWAKGRMLTQYCHGASSFGDYEEDTRCNWVGEPYIPETKRITNTDTLRLNEFSGWHYIVYDKYGHVQTDSATHDTRGEAMEALEESLTPRADYNDPAAPYTAVLFNVPSHVTIRGKMYRFKNGKVTKA